MSQPEWTVADFIYRGWWWNNRGILLLNVYLLLPLLTSTVNGLDSSLVNGLQILPAWQDQFGHPKGKALGLINSAQMIGGLVGLPFTPFCSDKFGRRATLFIGSLFMLGGVAMQSTANTVGRFVGARVLIGSGLTFGTNAAPLLITELAYPTQARRGKLTSIYNASWYMGSIIAAWTCFGAFNGAPNSLWSWRIPTLIQALGPLLQVCLIWLIPESPRWLVSSGREGQAARILANLHANGFDERDPLVIFEMAQIRHALNMEKEISNSTSIKALFSTPGNRKRMRLIVGIALFSQWSGSGLVSYYINLVLEGVGITSTSTKAAINGGLQIWNLTAAMTGALLIDRLGRRTLFIISNAGMLIAFSIWTLTTALFDTIDSAPAARATIPLIFVFYLFYDVAYTPMLVAYTLEILPYTIRAKGFALMNLTVSLTLAFNQFINPWALEAIGWKYYLVYCGWLGLELIFVLIYVVETRGRTLEETAALFDGEDRPADLVQMGGEAATMTMSRGAVAIESRRETPTYVRPEKRLTGESHELRMTRSTFEMDRWGESSGTHAL
ncbi:MFS sugar transporter [Heterobasidion irregulare TC 32-1]|uniref:MFS sugar transporter n=1 Tax=Heterobasidion irregulare (strain TC 32-1) TaxID=747525 RepID=W4KCH3_HETIT|nr:MFS sugar transporter [Heterobasidion irregulare TC 32-1]ETW83040.1 MFS sugar transporter [Heterobasidion irregulare TC 32-1]